MKNLKKVLALVMTFAMAFTMFTGAAFTDQADIKQTEAVDVLTALGVIKGNPDGSFKPDATVSRAEMAKMIYVLRTGKDDASAYASSVSTFKDINGHWAAGYIKYCQSLGIIAGKSATQFDPEATVTGEEAAKMLLVTLGYDAEKAGLVGSTWAKKTIALADENGLLDDVNAPMAMALPRQFAAQLMFNAVDTSTVKMTDGEYSNMNIVGNYYPTIGEKFMGLSKATGILLGSGKTGINGQTAGKTDSIAVEILSDNHKAYDYATVSATFTKVAKDYTALLGQTVKVLYKNGDKSKVYGVYATGDNKVVAGNTSKSEMKGAKVKFDGTEYEMAATVYTTVNGVKSNETVATTINKYKNTAATMTMVDSNNDDKYEVLNVVAPTVAKVSYVGASSITAGKSYKFADESIVDGIKKDDYAVIVAGTATRDGKTTITKADLVEGKITSTKGTDVQVDTTWYKSAEGKTGDVAELNETFKMAIVNGFIYNAEKVGSSVSNDKVLMVVNADSAKDGGLGGGTQKAKAMFVDGTEKEFTVAKLNGKAMANTGSKNEVVAKTLYTFSVKTNGEYELKSMDSTKYDQTLTNVASIDGGKATGAASATVRFADDAAIFVVSDKTGEDTKVLTGKAISGWKNVTGLSGSLYAKKSGGFNYANVGIIGMGNAAIPNSGDKKFGFVTGDSSLVKDGDKFYVSMSIWNGTEVAALNAKSTGTADVDSATNVGDGAFKAGTPVSFEMVDDKTIAKVTSIAANAVSITAYDGVKYISVSADGGVTNSEKKLTADSVKMYMNTDSKKGDTAGDITVATEIEKYFVKNAYVVANSANEVEFVLMDTTNCLASNKSEVTYGNVDAVVTKVDADKKVLTVAAGTKGDALLTSLKTIVVDEGTIVISTGAASANAVTTSTIVNIVTENGTVISYTVSI